ncbi:hypothetical protein FQR65_LT07315 [Abscondita terminalis]|nr:hypothetical protein FQR65_LT07315 [Abscondita terminalis]
MNKYIVVAALMACFVAVAVGAPSLAKGLPECPIPDPPYGAYFPDTEDCRYFYLCSNGVPIHIMCAPGTVFNSSLNVCVHQSDMSCIPSKSVV